jgi:hypothetical protein
MTEKQAKLVFNPAIARHLLKLGFTIIDIKAHKENKSKSVFVFSNEPGLEDEFNKYNIK